MTNYEIKIPVQEHFFQDWRNSQALLWLVPCSLNPLLCRDVFLGLALILVNMPQRYLVFNLTLGKLV